MLRLATAWGRNLYKEIATFWELANSCASSRRKLRIPPTPYGRGGVGRGVGEIPGVALGLGVDVAVAVAVAVGVPAGIAVGVGVGLATFP